MSEITNIQLPDRVTYGSKRCFDLVFSLFPFFSKSQLFEFPYIEFPFSVFAPFKYVNVTREYVRALGNVCYQLYDMEDESFTESVYSSPMVLIGIYISLASFFCILAMGLDLLYGFQNRKFWFPSKYFSLNAATITLIAVAMKLPVDLTTPMPSDVEQLAKLGSLGFMCTMMSNFMPSLASMDNKSLFASIIGLSILVVTMIVNIFIQIRTHLISPYGVIIFLVIAYMYMGMLLFLLMILISSSITLPTSKSNLELKYQATIERAFNDQNSQQNLIEKLRQLVKRYWIMAETGSPQFVMASNPLSSASGIICAISMLINISLLLQLTSTSTLFIYKSSYKWSMSVIVITQSIGTVLGSIAPIFRCFTRLSFISFHNQNWNHFLVFKVEKYWTQKLREWKESCISFLPSGPRSRVLLHNSKNLTLSFCIGFQKVIVVSCKLIGLIPIVVIILFVYCSYYFKSLKAIFFTPPITESSNDINEDLSNYVLLLEDNVRLATKTVKGISDSMNRSILNAEKKQHHNLLKLLEKSVGFDGVEMFDTDQVQSLLSVEHVNSWSLPVISLTCIAITLPNIHKDIVDNLLESVGEGIVYTHLVEESLNRELVYVNTRRARVTLWHQVEDQCKWLKTTLKGSAYEGKTAIEIVKHFAHVAEEILNKFNRGTNGELVVKENLPPKIVAANSMYRIAQTIIHTYASNNLEMDEMFTRLRGMIADILAACLTNIPRVIEIKCHESPIEKREASVKAAVELLGWTTQIIESLEKRELPNMDPDKMGFIDEWRLHLKQP